MVELEKKLAPELRFSEFTSCWELKTLSNLISHIDSGWSPNCEEKVAEIEEWGILKTTSTTWAGYNQNANKKLPNFLTPRTALEVKAGDILITRAGPVNRVGVVAFVDNTRAKLMISDKLIRVSKNENTDGAFLARLISTSKSQKYLNARTSGLAEAQANISQKILSKMPLIVPGLAEQQKIAAFLSAVDNKLTNLRRKRELLEIYKRGLMQQLFSQQIRFKQDDGSDFPDWEEKALNDLAERSTIKNADDSISLVLTNSATKGVVNQQDYFDKDIANANNLEGYYVVEHGDYVYNPRVSVHAPVGPIKKNKIGKGLMSPLYTIFRFKNEKNTFYEQYFNTTLWHKYMSSVANYGARHDRMNISMADFMNIPLPFPHPDEQEKMVSFLKSVDNKINAVAKQINQLDTFKKGLLQKLFV